MQVDGYSLDAQKDKLRKYAEYQDMTIVSEFSDEGFSGKNIKGRPEFSRMMEKIESGEDNVDFVLVFKLSRYGRNAADILNSLQIMQDYGVNLIHGFHFIVTDFHLLRILLGTNAESMVKMLRFKSSVKVNAGS